MHRGKRTATWGVLGLKECDKQQLIRQMIRNLPWIKGCQKWDRLSSRNLGISKCAIFPRDKR
jgi:hypothetical protein